MSKDRYQTKLLEKILTQNPSLRTESMEFQHLQENYQDYLHTRQLFIKFQLYDEALLRVYKNKSFLLNQIQLDRDVLEILNPKQDKRNLKNLKRNYTSMFKLLNGLFDRVSEPIKNLKFGYDREKTFFDLFGKTKGSLRSWYLFKGLFGTKLPLLPMGEFFLEKNKKLRELGVSVAEIQRIQ